MNDAVASAYRRLTDRYPFVRPTYNQFEVTFLPPFGDPEVHVPSEVGTYVVAGLVVNGITELLRDDD